MRCLIETQRADGTWDEPWFTGTGFPGDFYINYHLYRLVFPIMALGRYVDPPSRSDLPVGAEERCHGLPQRRGHSASARRRAPTAQASTAQAPTAQASTAQASPAGGHRDGPPVMVAWGHEVAGAIEADVVLDHTARFDSGRLASELEGLLSPAHPVVIVTQDRSRATGPAAGQVLVASELRLAARAAGLDRRRSLKGGGSLIATELRRAGVETEERALVVSPPTGPRGGADGALPHGPDDPGNWMALLGALGERPAVVLQVGSADTLAAAGPVLRRWARSLGGRQVHLAAPRSFCAGVERAIEIGGTGPRPLRTAGLRAPPDRAQLPRRAAT